MLHTRIMVEIPTGFVMVVSLIQLPYIVTVDGFAGCLDKVQVLKQLMHMDSTS